MFHKHEKSLQMSLEKLYRACRTGDLGMVRHLVEQGCDPNVNKHLDMVKYYVDLGYVVPDDNYAILLASRNGHLDVVKYLVSVGCDPKDNNVILWTSTMHRLASTMHHLEVVKYLLELGCDHENVKKVYKYEALQDVKLRLQIFMYTIPNKYLKTEILKRMIPSFNEREIMSILDEVVMYTN